MDLNVRAIRRGAKLTQKELAALIGCEVRTVRDWELGRRKPVEYYEKKLAELFTKNLENENERKLLRTFYTSRHMIGAGRVTVADVIDILYEYCDYEMIEGYLRKWAMMGFYRIRDSASCGTFIWDKLPKAYIKILKD